MKSATIQRVRDHADEVFRSKTPVLVTRNGDPIAVIQPLPNLSTAPIEARRKRFLKAAAILGAQLDAQGVTDEQIDRDIEAIRKNRRRR